MMLQAIAKTNRLQARHGRARRMGWLCVILAVGINLLLFLALGFVNRSLEGRPEDLDLTPVEVYVPPPEPPPPEPERAPMREPEREARSIEPMKMMNTLERFLPRIPRRPSDDALAVVPAVADLDRGGSAPGPFDLAAVDRAPQRTTGLAPRYPYWARLGGSEGLVTVDFIVNEEGFVEDVRIRSVEGDRRFGNVAVECIRKWRFRPGVYGGRKVPVRCVQRIRFRLGD